MSYFPQVFDIKLEHWLLCWKLECPQKSQLPKKDRINWFISSKEPVNLQLKRVSVGLITVFFGLWPDPGGENEAGVQVSRCVRLLHHQDLLDHPAEVQRDRLPTEGALQRRGSSGAGPGLASPSALLLTPQRGSGLPEAHGHRPGVPGALSQLLRRGHGHGEHGDEGQTVQRHLQPHGRL